ncbi:MAG: cysteine desulfurase [Lactobacillales bacterium]|jgi:cysteine desulfurase|nr:cysteine desulfurase [Lactobacillales bacterium]
MSIYFDNAATTELDPRVKDALISHLDVYGNSSSLHKLGRDAKFLLNEARRNVAAFIGADESEIVFTPSASAANNLVLKSFEHIISSDIEHPSVDEIVENKFRPSEVLGAITPDTELVSMMYVNNETGEILPVEELLSERPEGVLVHIDAVQAIGAIDIDVRKLNVDFLSLSLHKIHGLKGVGALYIKKGHHLKTLIAGGGQESGLISGTQDVVGIYASTLALESLPKLGLKAKLIEELNKNEIEFELNSSENSVEKTVNLRLAGVKNDRLLANLDLEEIYISAGSACSAGALKASRVLKNMGLSDVAASESIRISFSKYNTDAEVVEFVKKLKKIISRMRGN